MNKTIEKLALLHGRIKKGIATDEERMSYNIMIETSCIQKDILMKAIEQKQNQK